MGKLNKEKIPKSVNKLCKKWVDEKDKSSPLYLLNNKILDMNAVTSASAKDQLDSILESDYYNNIIIDLNKNLPSNIIELSDKNVVNNYDYVQLPDNCVMS